MKKLLALVLAGVVMCGSAAAFACDGHGEDEGATTASSGEATDAAQGEAKQEAAAPVKQKAKTKKKESKKEGSGSADSV